MTIAVGAQTERQGLAGPVRACLVAETPKELSPATILTFELPGLERPQARTPSPA
jgi:hypothetical protein